MQTPSLRTARIETIQKLTETVYVFTFIFLEPPDMSFQAGQYGTFIINSTTRRQYSFCSSPKYTNSVQIVIDTKPMGPGSTYFLSKQVGDTMQLLAPLGVFTLMPSPRKKVMIATGTGIAPLRSMILDCVGISEVTLLWGLRHEEDIYWHDEFQMLEKTYPTFFYTLTLSQPCDSWKGAKGRVGEYIQQEIAPDNEYYLCGNKQVIVDVKTVLLANNVQEGQIKTELF
ncbi:MAG: FAD-dependent oxidoreductase [Candidatus Gottesmanbacteria bacterium]